MKAYRVWVVALIAGLVACGPAVVKEEERPNFILVDIDSLRADRLENAPPAIKSLQARGTHFTHTITPAGWTLPSVSAILAGTPVLRRTGGWIALEPIQSLHVHPPS